MPIEAKLPPDFHFTEDGDLILPVGLLPKEWLTRTALALLREAEKVELPDKTNITIPVTKQGELAVSIYRQYFNKEDMISFGIRLIQEALEMEVDDV